MAGDTRGRVPRVAVRDKVRVRVRVRVRFTVTVMLWVRVRAWVTIRVTITRYSVLVTVTFTWFGVHQVVRWHWRWSMSCHTPWQDPAAEVPDAPASEKQALLLALLLILPVVRCKRYPRRPTLAWHNLSLQAAQHPTLST